jgi:hypothetical protein
MMVAALQEMRQASSSPPNPGSKPRFLLAFSNFLETMT